MTEERVCKSCGRPVDYLEYKEGNGKCYQCQPGYGGHSYTEGSDIAPSDADRIKHVITQLEIKLREAIREANHELKQRDETIKQLKEALREERNKAIDECIDAFLDKATDEGYFKKRTFSYQECKKLLESIKSDSK